MSHAIYCKEKSEILFFEKKSWNSPRIETGRDGSTEKEGIIFAVVRRFPYAEEVNEKKKSMLKV